MSGVIIVGEDDVTRALVKRILTYCHPGIVIDPAVQPVRGSQVKTLLPKYNVLAAKRDVVVLADLDQYDCAPLMRDEWLAPISINPNLLFRIAVTEGEAWLLADTKGFAKWLEVPASLIPAAVSTNPRREPDEIEVRPSCKPSLFIMNTLAPHSRNTEKRRMLTPRCKAKKSPEYNGCIVPFVETKWDIEAASKNSASLRRAVEAIKARFNTGKKDR